MTKLLRFLICSSCLLGLTAAGLRAALARDDLAAANISGHQSAQELRKSAGAIFGAAWLAGCDTAPGGGGGHPHASLKGPVKISGQTGERENSGQRGFVT